MRDQALPMAATGERPPSPPWRYIMLYTLVTTVELADDTEAADVLGGYLPDAIEPLAEVIEHRWYRDTDAEARAALVGVEWGGR